mgnify:FL=1|jgi:DNA transformation protein|tara:strand:+ start:28432 stop:28758 length:327 start_codon:yes stop_codon:yes gene_type:complete
MVLLHTKNTEYSNEIAALVLQKLVHIPGITRKKMFGGSGIMHNEKMFGLVDSKGNCFIKADRETIPMFIDLGGEQHSRMPYYSISEDNLKNSEKLLTLAEHAIKLSQQ